MVALTAATTSKPPAFDVDDPRERLGAEAADADVVVHLAGVNRPMDPGEFHAGNVGFTASSAASGPAGQTPPSSSPPPSQAERDNPYGASKLAAERVLEEWSARSGGAVAIFRLPNVFGKWGRPDYNSVVTTFCHNVARGCRSAWTTHRGPDPRPRRRRRRGVPGGPGEPGRGGAALGRAVTETTVGDWPPLQSFHGLGTPPDLPDLSDRFSRALFSTYLSYLEPDDLASRWTCAPTNAASLQTAARAARRPGLRLTHAPRHHSWQPLSRRQGGALLVSKGGAGPAEGAGHRRCARIPRQRSAPQAVIIPPGTTHSIENVGQTR